MTQIQIQAGGNLQAVLDAAQSGDVIELQAGATYSGNFVWSKPCASFVTLRSADPSRPARLSSPNVGPALKTTSGSSYLRLQDVEIVSTVTNTYNIVELGGHHFEFLKCTIRPVDDSLSTQRGIAANAAHVTILNSRVTGIQWKGFESQAVAIWDGPGPLLIENSYLESAGINFLAGGAKVSTPGLVPSDITIRGCTFYKRPEWRGVTTVKNLFELKNARRVTVVGNRMENSWPDAQTGWAVILNAGVDPAIGGVVVEDVEFAGNTILNSSNGFNIKGMENDEPAPRAKRINVHDNLFENLGAFNGEGKMFQVLNGTEEVAFEHNTVRQAPRQAPYGSAFILDAVNGVKHMGLRFTNNLLPFGEYGIFGNGGTFGVDAMNTFATGWTLKGCALIGAPADQQGKYPGNFFPADEATTATLVGTDNQPVGVRSVPAVPATTPSSTPVSRTSPAPTPPVQYEYVSKTWPSSASARLTLLNQMGADSYVLSQVVSTTAYFFRPKAH
jgi:hypothetical protein